MIWAKWLIAAIFWSLIWKGVLKLRKRVTLAVVVVSVIFGVCWITDSIVYIVSHFNTESFGPAVYSVSNTMIMLNSAVNPFVYGLVNQRFRRKIKIMLGCTFTSRVRVHVSRETHSTEMWNSTISRHPEEEYCVDFNVHANRHRILVFWYYHLSW